MTTMYRQGDVALIAAPAPTKHGKAVATKRIVLALGEVTGHSHTITGSVAEFAVDGRRMVWIEAPADLTHQEHAAIEVAPGWYWVVQQREYAPDAIRNVTD